MNSSKNTEKEIQKNLLEFIRMMDGLGPVSLSHLTHTTNNDRELAIFYLEPMVKKKWIISIRGHMENSYQMTKKGIDALEKMNVESAKRKLEEGQMDELITKENTDNKITKLSNIKTDLQKSLKSIYNDLLVAENGPDRNTFGFKHRLQVIHEDLQDVEMRICAEFSLGDFGVLPDFEPTHYRRGDSGMDQMLKSQIKKLAIEIDLNLEQGNITTEPTPDAKIEKNQAKPKITIKKILEILGIIAAIITISYFGNDMVNPQEPPIINIEQNEDLKILELDQKIRDHFGSHKPYQIVWELCNLSHEMDNQENTTAWKFISKPRMLDKESNEAEIPFRTSFYFTTILTDRVDEEDYSNDIQPPIHLVPVRNILPLSLDMTSIFSDALKFEPSFVYLTLDKSGFTPVLETSGNNMLDFNRDRESRIFAEFVYDLESKNWKLDETNSEAICQNLYQR